MNVYYVCDDRGVAHPSDGSVLKGGTKLPDDFDPVWAKHLCDAGWVRLGSPGPSPVDIYQQIPISSDVDEGIVKGTPAKTTPQVWNFTDAQLQGKSLDDMNALIVERGGEPKTTIEDAILQLQAEMR